MHMLNVFIPAREDSTRLPGKVLLPVCGRPLIHYAISTAKQLKSRWGHKVYVVTDSPNVRAACIGLCDVIMTGPAESGSKRIIQAIKQEKITSECINLQADVPYLEQKTFEKLSRSNSRYSTLFYATQDIKEAEDPNKVKIAGFHPTGARLYARYFSRSKIPYYAKEWLIHVGVYKFSYSSLIFGSYSETKNSYLVETEKLEQLECSENIRLIESPRVFNIDTKQDLDEFEEFVKNNPSLFP